MMHAFTPQLFTLLKNGYSKSAFFHDAIAGLTVAIVALPLAMALAIASGASPEKGLITAVIAGSLISLLGGSRVQIGGPTGAFVVVIFNVIGQHGYSGLVLVTIMAGFILVVAGYAKLGQVIKFIPSPVITGFTAGIAVIIASTQIKDFFGLPLNGLPIDFLPKWSSLLQSIHLLDLPTLTIGLSALLTIIFLRRFAPMLPGFLIAAGISALVVYLFNIPIDTIGSRFPDIPTGLAMPTWPAWDFSKLQQLLPSAFTIAFLAGIEALLSAVVADGMTGYKHRPNQELVAQGFANIASGLFAGLPATGAIARTTINIRAGGKTPMAGIFHAAFLLIFMLFAMDIMAFVPMAALAAILFVVAWSMSEVHQFIHIFKLSRGDRSVMLLTFLLTVLIDLTVAIGVGVTLAMLLFMKHMAEAVEIKPEWRHATAQYDEETPYNEQRRDLPHGVEVFQITGPFFFGVASDLIDTLKSLGQIPSVLILRMRLVPYLDATGESALESVMKQCKKNGTQIVFSGLRGQPMRMLQNAHIADTQSHIHFASDYKTALEMAETLVKNTSPDLTQTPPHSSA